MPSLNKVILIGHLGKDPEVRQVASGNMTTVSLATSESWKDKSGDKRIETQWHNLVFFGKLADIAAEYLRKGALVYVEGRIKSRVWKDKDGNDRYTTEIICDQMKMLGGKGEAREMQESSKAVAEKSEKADDDDDIPF